MFGNLKMKTLLSFGVGIVSLVCLVISGIVIGRKVEDISRNAAITNMNTSLAGQAALIELFVSDSESMLKSYASADEIINLLKEPDNPEYINAAQAYTEKFFEKLNDWEGIYLSDWNTKVLAHSSAGAVGMVTRTEDQLPAYRATMTNSYEGFYNGGAFVSPASGQLIFNLRMAVYDENKKPIGFVGGGPFISGLHKVFEDAEIKGLENKQYAIIDTVNKLYAYHTNTDMITTPVEDEFLLTIAVEAVARNGSGVKSHDGKMTVYKYVDSLNLMVLMQDDEKELLADSNAIIGVFIFFIIITEILVMLATIMVSAIATAPLNKVTRAVNDLGGLSLKTADRISDYSGRKSEVGMIATSVESLTDSLQKIVSMLSKCSVSLNKGSKVMINTVSSLSHCADENTATANELSAGVNYANTSIQRVNEEIGTISGIMHKSRKSGTERISAADKMIKNIGEMFSNITQKTVATEKNINESMGYLDNFSKINENIKIIQDIAKQTQLLAVNASIESSKAGEAGKSFAVVASEIKRLAVDSSTSADAIYAVCVETNSNIENVKSCFAEIISFMKSDIANVFKIVQDASTNLRSSIEGINADMDSISEFIKNIGAQANELKGVVLKNEDGVENISEKIKITNDMVRKLNDLVEKNMETAKSINFIISKFK